jgi:hypothetical protein
MSCLLPNPSHRHKWFFIVAFVVALVVVSLGMALHQALSSPPRSRASSTVLMTPFTNGVLAKSFQARTFQSIPGAHLEQRGTAGLIEVVAYAATAAEAQTNANQATDRLACAAMETFGVGVRVSTIRGATSARRTSIFHPQ